MPIYAPQIIGSILPAQTDFTGSSADDDPATIGHVKILLKGLGVKSPVRVATATNITLTSPGSSIDGVSMSSGESFLVFGQTTASQNGIYIWNGSGVAATRRLTENESVEIVPSMIFLAQEGTYAEKMFRLTTNGPITIDSTSLVFTVESTLSAPVPTLSNKNMTGSTTTADGDQATSTTVASTPAQDGWVQLLVGSVPETIGDGDKLSAAYISGDNGSTARTIAAIAAGDKIYWNGSIAGYELNSSYKLHLIYNV